MQLFKSITPVQSYDPVASLEALQEITDICNSIHNSTPAFEALMELPSLAQEFNTTSTASLSMLSFVTEQHYNTLGLTNVSVSQEGVVSTVVDAVARIIEWIRKKVVSLSTWFKSLFNKKPAEQVAKVLEEDIKTMNAVPPSTVTTEFKMSSEDRAVRLRLLKGLRALIGTVNKAFKISEGLFEEIEKTMSHIDRLESNFPKRKPDSAEDYFENPFLTDLRNFNSAVGCLSDYFYIPTSILHSINKLRTHLVSKKEVKLEVARKAFFELEKATGELGVMSPHVEKDGLVILRVIQNISGALDLTALGHDSDQVENFIRIVNSRKQNVNTHLSDCREYMSEL